MTERIIRRGRRRFYLQFGGAIGDRRGPGELEERAQRRVFGRARPNVAEHLPRRGDEQARRRCGRVPVGLTLTDASRVCTVVRSRTPTPCHPNHSTIRQSMT